MRALELNGHPPSPAEMDRLAGGQYGHFTSMQVRGFAVRGLALHLARLADGNEQFFDYRMGVDDEQRLLGLIRHALGDEPDASVRVSFVRSGSHVPDILVSVGELITLLRDAWQSVPFDPL